MSENIECVFQYSMCVLISAAFNCFQCVDIFS